MKSDYVSATGRMNNTMVMSKNGGLGNQTRREFFSDANQDARLATYNVLL